ncbi:MAG TPA: cyclic nucleotide-binding domain-containing protein, partial [Planctomycetaceae bacterium]|nr:cyclic nucleotide-binding domain-containing protein [Planctomycetaceae bacterium]
SACARPSTSDEPLGRRPKFGDNDSPTCGKAAEPVGFVHEGECLGEMSLLRAAPDSATAVAATDVEVAVLSHDEVNQLVHLRRDIGGVVFRNLANGMTEKIKRVDQRLLN